MDREAFREALLAARSELDTALARVDENRVAAPGVSGEMSVKDIVAHIAWFEAEMIGVLLQHALVGSDLWNLPPDERNAVILRENRARTWSDVRREGQRTFRRFRKAAEGLTEQELNDPGCFRDMPPDWIPWQVLAGNSFEHYAAHAADIRRWLEGQR